MNDYYALLHLHPGCSAAEIRSAYRRLARRYHPDLNPSPDAARRMAAINEAYAVLGNPVRRRAYDLARGRSLTLTPAWGRPSAARPRGTEGGGARQRTAAPGFWQATGAARPRGVGRTRRLRWVLVLVPALLACWAALLTLVDRGGAAQPLPLASASVPADAPAPAQPLLTLGQPVEGVALLAFSADAALLAVAARTGVITVWRTATGEQVATLVGHGGAVQSLVFLADNRLLVSISLDQTARLWDVTTGREVSRLRMPEEDGAALSLALSPSADLLAMAHVTDTIAVWSLVTHQKIVRFPLPAGAGPVTALRFAPDGSLLAATLAGGRTALFRLPPLGEAETGNGPQPTGLVALLGTPFVAVGPRGSVVTLAGRGEEGFTLGPGRGEGLRLQAVTAAGSALATAFAVSADGRTAAWAGPPGGGLVPVWPVSLWDTLAERPLATLVHPVPVLALALAPDGSLAATAARDGAVRLWRVPRAR